MFDTYVSAYTGAELGYRPSEPFVSIIGMDAVLTPAISSPKRLFLRRLHRSTYLERSGNHCHRGTSVFVNFLRAVSADPRYRVIPPVWSNLLNKRNYLPYLRADGRDVRPKADTE